MATDTLPLMPTGADAPLQGTQAMVTLLRQWRDAGWVRALDTAFAEFLARQRPDVNPMVLLAGTLASHQSGRGHLLLDLEEVLRNPGGAVAQVDLAPSDTQPATTPEDLMGWIDLAAWQAALAHSELVSTDGAERRPWCCRTTGSTCTATGAMSAISPAPSRTSSPRPGTSMRPEWRSSSRRCSRPTPRGRPRTGRSWPAPSRHARTSA
ncbi:hypothetical protein [Halomonas sp. E19]|uniref:hypothetical protein n=1 Tax=Halomonas sp. E19 TaxID=3397247 RepID=UPI0040344112